MALVSYTEGDELPDNAKFTCEISGDKYMFRTSDNKYMAYPPHAANGVATGGSQTGIETEVSDKTKFSIGKILNGGNVSATNDVLFGALYFTGYRGSDSGNNSQYIVVKTSTGVWDAAGEAYANANYSSAISIIDAESEPVTTYTASVTANPGTAGTATVNGEQTVTVNAGTSVSFSATPNAGYEFVNWTNGENEVSGDNPFSAPINANITLTANFRETEQAPTYVIDFGNTTGGNDRGLTSIQLSDGEHTGTVSVNQPTTTPTAIYIDKLSTKIQLNAGATISPTVTTAGSWMHTFLYIDFDKDGSFEYDLAATNYIPTENSELLAFSFWSGNDDSSVSGYDASGYDHKGTYLTGDNRNVATLKTFTLPASIEPGEYRARIKYDWNKIDGNAIAAAANHPCVADFTVEVIKKHTVTVATSPTDGGTAKVNNEQSVTVNNGTEVTFTASANTGYDFLGWYNGETKVNDNLEFTQAVTSNLSLTAKFAKQTFTVSATAGENGIATVSPNGTVEYGTEVTFTATANAGYRFTCWSNGETANPYITTITANTELTANFEALQSFTINVTTNGEGGTASATSNSVYENGQVTLTAKANDGYRFTGWYQGGEFVTKANPYTIQSVTGNIDYVANFEESSDELLLTFACLSDLHAQEDLIADANNIQLRESVTKTLNQIKSQENIDLIVLGGDYVSNNTLPQSSWQTTKDLLVTATRGVFKDGQKTPVIYVNGNHDYEVANYDALPKDYNVGEYYGTPMKTDIGALAAEDCFYETADATGTPTEVLAAYHYVVNGFDFVVLNAGKYLFASASDYQYSIESVQWCANKLAQIYATDKNKTVFFLVHIPFSDSNSLSNTNKGMNKGASAEFVTLLKSTLAQYPNLVMLYGHDHGTDSAYIREATSQRVTEYGTDGNVWTGAGSSAGSPLYSVQNYSTSTYLGYQ